MSMERSMKKKVTGLSLVMVTGALVGLWACQSYTANPYGNGSGGGGTNTVTMYNLSFSPSTLTISRMTTVTWRNNDGVVHTSTSNTGVWDTGSIPAGGTRTTTFDSSGTFPYHCSIHPSMTGTIIVQ